MTDLTDSGITASQRFPGLSLNGVRLRAYLFYCAGLAIAYWWTLRFLPDSSQAATLAIAFAIGAIVPVCLIFRRQLDLLEPIYWFSAMYFAFFVGAVYFILTDFQFSQHNLISDSGERNRILHKALLLILAGYAMFLTGYLVATLRGGRVVIDFDGDDGAPDWLLRTAAVALIAIGALNFVYLIANYPGGLFRYYAEMGLRQHRLDAYGAGITTLGLQFIYAAVWLWLFVIMRSIRRGQRLSLTRAIVFTLGATASAAVLASQGRLFQTVSFALALAGMVYAFSDHPRRNRAMLIGGAGLVIAGLALYFGRLLSLLIYNRPEVFAQLGWNDIVDTFFRMLGRFILDGGNVTDLTSFMNIVAYWERDFSFLYGSSFLSPVSRLVAGVEFQSVAETTQATWTTGIGAWPPTFVGELYANLGAVGVIGGMLVAGFLAGRAYRFCARRRNFWTTLLLCALTFRFFFILPKGETVNLTGTVWMLLPALAAYGVIKLVCVAARRHT